MTGLLSTLEQWDKVATLWINHFHSPVTDSVWLFFSAKTVWIPFYLLLIYLLFRRLGWKKALIALVAIALTVAACDQLANLVKNTVCRLRPNKDSWMIERGLHILQKGGLYGFFSAHAANCFAVAMCASRIWHFEASQSECGMPDWIGCAWTPVLFIWAALVALSRVFVAKHFLGDILVGALVGAIIGFVIAECARAINRRMKV